MELLTGLRELRDYASHYLHARLDLARLEVRRGMRSAVVATALAVLGVGALLTSIVFLIKGFAGMLGGVFTGPGVGDALAGSAVIATFVLAALVHNHISRSRSLATTVEKYESRKAQQLARYGRSVGNGVSATSASERNGQARGEPVHA